MLRLIRLIKTVCLISVLCLGINTAYATNCPHTVDIYLTDNNNPTVPKTTLRNLILPKGPVNLTGMMLFNIAVYGPSGGDSCIVTFDVPGGQRNIGAGLTLGWENMYFNVSPNNTPQYQSFPTDNSFKRGRCGQQYPIPQTRGNSYKWNANWADIAYGTRSTRYAAYETWMCSPDTFWVPFNITGTYTGETISLKPYSSSVGGTSNPTYRPAGWYAIAAGELSSRFNPTSAFWDNISTVAPLVLTGAGSCTQSISTAPQNSNFYFTQSNLKTGDSIELANFYTSQEFRNCNFLPTDQMVFYRRKLYSGIVGVSEKFFVRSNSYSGNGLSFQTIYKFRCTNCGPTPQDENIEMHITQTLSGLTSNNTACGITGRIVVPNIYANNLTNCTSLKLLSEVKFVQTGNLLNKTVNPNAQTSLPVYPFSYADIGYVSWAIKTTTLFTDSTSYKALAKSDITLGAPAYQAPNACAALDTERFNQSKDISVEGKYIVLPTTPETLASWETTTKATGCAFDTTKSVSASPSITNKTLIKKSSIKTENKLVSQYQFECTTCGTNVQTKYENIIFQVTQTLSAENKNLTAPKCSATMSSASKFTIGNLQNCDTLILNEKFEILQTAPMVGGGQEGYKFLSNQLIATDFSVPQTNNTTPPPISSNEQNIAVNPTLGGGCVPTLKSTIKRKRD